MLDRIFANLVSPSPDRLTLVPHGVFSSLAGGLLIDAVNALKPGQSLIAEVKAHIDGGQSVRVGVEVRDGRGATFYEVVVTVRHAEPARQLSGG